MFENEIDPDILQVLDESDTEWVKLWREKLKVKWMFNKILSFFKNLNKCRFHKICKHYQEKGLTCNTGGRGYCGQYRTFIYLQSREQEMQHWNYQL